MSNVKNEKVVKVTKKERFNQLLQIEAVKGNQDLVDFINHEIELLTKKNASDNGKMSKAQLENQKLAEVVLEAMTKLDKPVTATEILKAHSELAELSNQKIVALLKILIADGLVERYEEKRKTLFRLVK